MGARHLKVTTRAACGVPAGGQSAFGAIYGDEGRKIPALGIRRALNPDAARYAKLRSG
jgi:hypothetical protein